MCSIPQGCFLRTQKIFLVFIFCSFLLLIFHSVLYCAIDLLHTKSKVESCHTFLITHFLPLVKTVKSNNGLNTDIERKK